MLDSFGFPSRNKQPKLKEILSSGKNLHAMATIRSFTTPTQLHDIFYLHSSTRTKIITPSPALNMELGALTCVSSLDRLHELSCQGFLRSHIHQADETSKRSFEYADSGLLILYGAPHHVSTSLHCPLAQRMSPGVTAIRPAEVVESWPCRGRAMHVMAWPRCKLPSVPFSLFSLWPPFPCP